MPPPRLAKLTRPRTEGLVPRLRLFEALDAACARPVVWISGPPGAGKTSLVSSYLEARSRPCLWYQADSGDADPATFFYYLGLAAEGLSGQGSEPLPLFTEDYAADLEPFSRRFFRSLWAQLGEGGILILDNYQEVPAASPFHDAVRVATEELPEGSTLCAVSRADAPTAFSRLRANQRLSAIGWADLKLTADETAAIAASAAPDEATVELLQAQSGGWAAGVVLMLERIRQSGGLRAGDTHENLETIFDYFAGQVFHGAARETQEMLLRMAQLPRLTAETAQVVTGNPGAGKLLATLAKRNLFTDRRVGEQTSYQFHALFREFLKAQARERLGAAELHRVTHSAAALLQATGQVEDAFVLFVEEGAWGPAAELVKAQAEALLSQGRRETLRGWIDAFPAGYVEADGWLMLWRAMTARRGAASSARESMSRAYGMFTRAGDRVGQVAAAVAATDLIFASPAPLTQVDEWIPRLREAVVAAPSLLDAEWHARATSRYCRAQFVRDPLGPEATEAYDSVWNLLRKDISPITKYYAASVLAVHNWILGYPERTDELMATMRGVPVPAEATQDSSVRLYRYFVDFHSDLQFGPQRPDRLEELPPDLDSDTLIGPLNADIARMRAHALILRRRFADAKRLLDEHVEPILPSIRTTMRSFSYGHLATCALAAGQPDRAVAFIDGALEVLAQGLRSGSLLLVPYLAGMLACAGQVSRGATLLDEFRASVDLSSNSWLSGRAAAMRALIHLKQDAVDDALAELRVALGRLKGVSYWAWMIVPDPDFDRLFALALEHGIETEFVTTLIRNHGVPAPDADADYWPWPLRLRLLGTYRVEGLPAAKSGKAQHKLNDLLSAIAVAGPEGIALQTLADRLWPDSEGDAALNTLQVTLYRLRKMLGREDALLVADGVVRIQRHVCWVDAWAFESKAARAMAESLQAFVPAAREALALYRGHLLALEEDKAWAIAPRDRLRRAWLSLVAKLGEALEREGDGEGAIAFYEQALDGDPQAEALYRSLMRCHSAGGDSARVAQVYERCRAVLAGTLGVEPSAETRRLYREALQASGVDAR